MFRRLQVLNQTFVSIATLKEFCGYQPDDLAGMPIPAVACRNVAEKEMNVMRIILLAVILSAVIAVQLQSPTHYDFAARQAIFQVAWT